MAPMTDSDRLKAMAKLRAFLGSILSEKSAEKLQKSISEFSGDKDNLSSSAKVADCLGDTKNAQLSEAASTMLKTTLNHLLPKLEVVKKRSEVEVMVDELNAHAMLGVLSTVASPTCSTELAARVIDDNFDAMLRYVLAVKHFCEEPDQCGCYRGPIENAIETVVFAATAKNSPDQLTPAVLQTIEKHYNDKISVNYVLGLSLLNVKRPKVFEPYFEKTVKRLSHVLSAKRDTMRSTLVIRTGPGSFLAQGQPTDFVLIALDRVLKPTARRSPQWFDKKTVDLLDKFFTEQRPMSMLIALDILSILADKNPEILKGIGAEYRVIAGELDLPDAEVAKIEKIVQVSGVDERKARPTRSRSVSTKKSMADKTKPVASTGTQRRRPSSRAK
uniref:Uncharacterized protein n=1 Tax=Plectus sambesii TaxID=2011161 RepID=A0A914VD92_9BILA